MTSITRRDDPTWKKIEDIIDHMLKRPRFWSSTAEGLEASLTAYIDCWCWTRLQTQSNLIMQFGELFNRERRSLKIGSRAYVHSLKCEHSFEQTTAEKRVADQRVIDVYGRIWKTLKDSVPALIQLAEAAE